MALYCRFLSRADLTCTRISSRLSPFSTGKRRTDDVQLSVGRQDLGVFLFDGTQTWRDVSADGRAGDLYGVKSRVLPGPRFLILMAAVLPPRLSPSSMGSFRLMLSTDRSDFGTGTAPLEAVETWLLPAGGGGAAKTLKANKRTHKMAKVAKFLILRKIPPQT